MWPVAAIDMVALDTAGRRRCRGPMQKVHAAAPAKQSTSPVVQRKCACGKGLGSTDERSALQRQAAGPAPEVAPPIVHEVLGSPGRPLDAPVQRDMEERFGFDFSQIRIHT